MRAPLWRITINDTSVPQNRRFIVGAGLHGLFLSRARRLKSTCIQRFTEPLEPERINAVSKPWSEAAKEEGEIACRQAVQKSQAVPGYKPVRVPTLGQRTFAAMVTMDAETHVGLGALDHN